MRFAFLFLLGATLGLKAQAQNTSPPDLAPYFTAVLVDDFNESLAWYQDVLGFELIDQTQNKERGFAQANLQRGAALLELIALDSAFSQEQLNDINPDIARVNGFFKIGFSVSNFDEWLAHLTESGVQFNGSVVVNPQSGKRMVIIKDPDGNRIQLFEK